MGRNKDLRKRTAGLEAAIAEHENKIRKERTSHSPNEALIASWKGEILVWEETVTRLVRRLNRER